MIPFPGNRWLMLGHRRKRHGCRPNRTPAAGRCDRRQSIGPPQPFPSPRRARQARPSASPGCGLPLVQLPRRFRCAHGTVGRRRFGSERRHGMPFARRQRRRGTSRGEFSGPDGTGDAPVHLAGLMRKRRPAAPFTLLSPVGGVPEKARSELLPAPQRRTTGLPASAQPENPG